MPMFGQEFEKEAKVFKYSVQCLTYYTTKGVIKHFYTVSNPNWLNSACGMRMSAEEEWPDTFLFPVPMKRMRGHCLLRLSNSNLHNSLLWEPVRKP